MSTPLTSGPIVLAILDGYGIAPDSPSNPASVTELPIFTKLRHESLHTRLWAHGEHVGLPKDQDGNSEAGHLNLGAGRIVKQDTVIIADAIRDGTFFKNPAFREAILHVKQYRSGLHLIGMLSDGQSAHATPEHLYALLELADQERVRPVWLHLFTDGRDSDPHTGRSLLDELETKLKSGQRIASIVGRFYAMDRKKVWRRTEAAYQAIVRGKGECAGSAQEVFDKSYAAGASDEFIAPHVICENGQPLARVKDNDSIIFFNHRSDRARQLAKPFVQPNFVRLNPGAFEPEPLGNLRFAAMTDFGPDLGEILTAFPSAPLPETLPLVLADKRQLYLAESEKYAHITYFFNGGQGERADKEDQQMVLSPNVETYDQAPAMASAKLAEIIGRALEENKYDFIAVNFAALDMVAHTGDWPAAKLALEAVDRALGSIMTAIAPVGGVLIVTGDHGNIEEISNRSDGELNTKHSKNPVPFLLWAPANNLPALRPQGILADVGPTILELFGIRKPEVMTGKSLFAE